MTRQAECSCGAVKAVCEGEPVRVSVCHCRNCQRRSGSSFAVQARWPAAQVTLTGEMRDWVLAGDESRATFRSCPVCSATIAYTIDSMPGVVAIPVGAFADPAFAPGPEYSVYESRKHGWVEIVGDMAHYD